MQLNESAPDGIEISHSVSGPIRAIIWMGNKNLTPKQLAILLICFGAPRSMTPSQLAMIMSIHLPSVSLSISELERRGYITRNRSPHDRRTVEIEVTVSGRELAKHWLEFTKEQPA